MTHTKLFSAALMATTALGSAAFAQTELSLWYHGAGNEVESAIINQIIDDFNASQADYAVVVESFPQDSYNDSVVAAALAGNLPCILDVDGPVMPNWAWSGYLQPLPIDEADFADFLPGTKGIWDGKLYSIGSVGRGRRALCAPVDARRARPAHAHARRTLDRRRVHGRAGSRQGERQLRLRARSRHGLDR